MPVCPRCYAEYKDGIERCSDCSIELVDSLPEFRTESAQDQELVELAVFSTVPEAEMLKELLERNDIDSIVRGETDPIGTASGAAPVAILVERQNLAAAKEVYEAFFAGEVDDANSQQAE